MHRRSLIQHTCIDRPGLIILHILHLSFSTRKHPTQRDKHTGIQRGNGRQTTDYTQTADHDLPTR